MMNKHTTSDLKQMQSLPLESKIRMAQERIRVWYESWKKYTIYDSKAKKTRCVTWKEEPSENGCYVKKRKKINGKMVEIDVLVNGTKLKPSEYIESVIDGQVYMSFSGGKDSTVLKHIVDGMYSDVPSVFVNTGLEYPEIQKFVRDVKYGKYECFNSNVEIIRPEMRFDEVIKKFGYPIISKEIAQVIEEARNHNETGKYTYRMKRLNGELLDKNGNKSIYNCEKWKFMLDAPFLISNKCCDVMKKKPSKEYEKHTSRKPILGTMASESKARTQSWMKTGCNGFESNRPVSKPLSFWTEQDVLHYINQFSVPYCPVYGDIQIKRTEEVTDGQINLIDYLGCYEPEDVLETTGCNRTGCMFCMFGVHLEKEPNRFQRMKKTHPKQYEYCMKSVEDGGLGLAKVLDYIGVIYE